MEYWLWQLTRLLLASDFELLIIIKQYLKDNRNDGEQSGIVRVTRLSNAHTLATTSSSCFSLGTAGSANPVYYSDML